MRNEELSTQTAVRKHNPSPRNKDDNKERQGSRRGFYICGGNPFAHLSVTSCTVFVSLAAPPFRYKIFVHLSSTLIPMQVAFQHMENSAASERAAHVVLDCELSSAPIPLIVVFLYHATPYQ